MHAESVSRSARALRHVPCLFQERVKAFSRWVDARPEKIIVLVGHSTYLRELTGMKSRLKNGELHTQHF